MRCPFLEEAHVAQCSSSALKIMIVRPTMADHERCSSPDFARCPAFRAVPHQEESQTQCPYLDETMMQYCSAAPVVKYIRPTQSLLARCGTDRFRYCDLYLALATAGRPPGDLFVDQIRVPRLWFAPNHMWVDPGVDGTSIVGIDAFLARALGTVERLRFANPSGFRRPAAVVTVRGVDVELVFPRPLLITGTHTYLRAKPAALTQDPYGQGWLFECKTADLTGLMHGEEVTRWMQKEVDRLSAYVHTLLERVSPAERADGGTFGSDLVENLSRTEIIHLFEKFFSPSGEERTHS